MELRGGKIGMVHLHLQLQKTARGGGGRVEGCSRAKGEDTGVGRQAARPLGTSKKVVSRARSEERHSRRWSLKGRQKRVLLHLASSERWR